MDTQVEKIVEAASAEIDKGLRAKAAGDAAACAYYGSAAQFELLKGILEQLTALREDIKGMRSDA